MDERPGEEDLHRGPLGIAIATAIRGNATAFGYSITITGSFGMLQTLVGSPTAGQIFLFGVAAALAAGLTAGAVTHGFRARVGMAPLEVSMLGTAQDFVSVAAGIGACAGVAELLGTGVAWPLGAFAATLVFLAAESAEIVVAQAVQKRRGDRHAEEAEDE